MLYRLRPNTGLAGKLDDRGMGPLKLWAITAVLAVLVAAVVPPASAENTEKCDKPDPHDQYVRLVREEGTVTALETAVVRFAPKDRNRSAPRVDLVAAIHVADESYFNKLNELFKTYDVVLYELVAPEGTRIPKGGAGAGSGHPVSMLQKLMTNVLDLQYQLNAIDYTKANFVHADLSPERFAESMKRRGESMWTMLFRMMGYAMAQQGGDGSSDAQFLAALLDPNRSLALKRLMAEQFRDMDGAMGAIEGPDGSAIITDRNRAALDVLKSEIEAGKQKIAVFYGGGHMPDFAQRLRDEFDLVPVETKWLTAWDMKKAER